MKVLIAFYSRSGVTRKAAQRVAEDLKAAGAHAEVEEVIDTKDRRGIIGWIGGGKDATLKRPATIEPIKADVARFDFVVIATPVWAWSVTPAIRSFCIQHGAACRRIAFLCTMGNTGDKGAFAAMKDLTGKDPVATLTLIDRKVRSDDEPSYLTPVCRFAGSIMGAKE